ncbi:response regulator [Halostella sp. JP-L12]|uniref:response regulator n=1 Tax=Halostella TaxID=1843185 RepID=UPI000EF7F691|nr:MULTISPECIES: response regulator [Halostella]NHN48405.1 response regulator [Halostella sp. JP-L12]
MGIPKHLGDILLVEDNPGDIRLTKEMLEEGGYRGTFHVVTDGTEALDFLHRRGEYADAPRPDTVLLDMHLPRMNGDEVVETVKETDGLDDIPVVLLTGSLKEGADLEADIPEADAYIRKPIGPGEFSDAVQSCEDTGTLGDAE